LLGCCAERHSNGEKTMQTSFKSLLATSAAALLTACGGGGSSSTAGSGVAEAIAAMEGNWGTGNNCIVAFGAEFATPQSYTGTRVYTKTGDNTVSATYSTSFFEGGICSGTSGQPNAAASDTLTIDGSEVINGIRYIRYTENGNGNKALMGISADGTQIFAGRPLAAAANTTTHPTEIIDGFSSSVTGNFISQALTKGASVTMPARLCEKASAGFKVCGVEIRGANGAALAGYSETEYNSNTLAYTAPALTANGNGMDLSFTDVTDPTVNVATISPQDGTIFSCRANNATTDTRVSCLGSSSYSLGTPSTYRFGKYGTTTGLTARPLMKTGITGRDRLNPSNYMAISGELSF
jgi:hypothetical protein